MIIGSSMMIGTDAESCRSVLSGEVGSGIAFQRRRGGGLMWDMQMPLDGNGFSLRHAFAEVPSCSVSLPLQLTCGGRLRWTMTSATLCSG
jgi:hypothetical protein